MSPLARSTYSTLRFVRELDELVVFQARLRIVDEALVLVDDALSLAMLFVALL